jgi:hypothetical protein
MNITDLELKLLAIKAGISKSEIIEIYKKSIIEAKSLGKQNDKEFILEIIKSFVGLEENDKNNSIINLNNKFIHSGYADFNTFLEDLWLNEDIVSTDFSPDVRPEHMLGHAITLTTNIEDDDEDKDKDEE